MHISKVLCHNFDRRLNSIASPTEHNTKPEIYVISVDASLELDYVPNINPPLYQLM